MYLTIIVVVMMLCSTTVKGASVHSVVKREDGPHCIVKGDPHYETFDGYKYTFMGNCTYMLLAWCNKRNGKVQQKLVTVSTKNEHPNNNGHTRVVSLRLNRLRSPEQFTEFIPDDCSFRFNGDDWTKFPHVWPGMGSVQKDGNIFTFETFDQYRVIFDCKIHMVEIILLHPDTKHICGMCGNRNGIGTEDDELQGYSTINEMAEAFEHNDRHADCK